MVYYAKISRNISFFWHSQVLQIYSKNCAKNVRIFLALTANRRHFSELNHFLILNNNFIYSSLLKGLILCGISLLLAPYIWVEYERWQSNQWKHIIERLCTIMSLQEGPILAIHIYTKVVKEVMMRDADFFTK